MKIDHNFYMQLALDEAWKYQLLTYPNPAVGCLILKNGKILSIEAHKEAGQPHAEVNALKSAYLAYKSDRQLEDIENSHGIHEYLIQNHNGFFNDCTIYVTLEPCNHIGKTPACAMLLEVLKPKKLVIGTLDPNTTASGGYERLMNVGIEVEVGILQKKCNDLLYPFILWQQKSFRFFKMAQRLDGSIDGGKISGNKSLQWVHQLRTKIDCLLIGGNTVRIDRPTLDARFVNGKVPDVAIYSQAKHFDQNINLFQIPNREVKIINELSEIDDKKFVMIEGGYTFQSLLDRYFDMLIIILSPTNNVNAGKNSINSKYEILYHTFNGEDIIIYLKKK